MVHKLIQPLSAQTPMDQVDNHPTQRAVAIISDAPILTRFARGIVAFLAKRVGMGYGLVPLRHPDWIIKSAMVEEYISKSLPRDSYKSGLHAGQALCFRHMAEEIKEFQKTA